MEEVVEPGVGFRCAFGGAPSINRVALSVDETPVDAGDFFFVEDGQVGEDARVVCSGHPLCVDEGAFEFSEVVDLGLKVLSVVVVVEADHIAIGGLEIIEGFVAIPNAYGHGLGGAN